MKYIKIFEQFKANKVDISKLSTGNTYKDSKGYPVKVIKIGGSGKNWTITIEDQFGKEKLLKGSLDNGVNLYEN